MIEKGGPLVITSKLLTYMQFKCRIKLPFNNECLKLARIIRQGLSENKLKDYQFVKSTLFYRVSFLYFPDKWYEEENKYYNEYDRYWRLVLKPDKAKVFIFNLFSSWRRNE